MAIGRSCNSSLNFEVLLLFLLCLYAILHVQSCILNPPSDIYVFPRAHATVFVNNKRPLSFASLVSSWPKDTSSSFESRCDSLNFHEMGSLKLHHLLLLHARMLWGCPGEPWTCCQLYSGRFFLL